MAPIIDQHGNPISSQDLKQTLDEPQSARVVSLQNQMIESHLDGLTPGRVAATLRDADAGNILAQHQLFDDMIDRDAHLRSEYDKRCQAPLTLDWRIVPPKNPTAAETRAAEFADDVLRTAVDDFEDVVLSMMDAVGHGFAAIELDWERHGRELLPSFHPRPQTWLRLSQDRTELRLNDGSADGAILRPFGWILHMHRKPKTGYIARSGLFRVLLWPFMYKAFSVGDLAELLDLWGLPIVIGKYNNPSTPEAKSSLYRAVAALGRDGRAIMPSDMEIEVMKATAGGDNSPHMAMMDWAERSQSKTLLGQTLSSDAQPTGLGSGVANLHGEVRHDILMSDVRQLADTLTRDLVYPLIALNVGGIDAYRRCPRFEFDTSESADLKLFADSLPVLAQHGARIPVNWVHKQLQIPEAAEGEAVFGALPAAATPPPGSAALSAAHGPGCTCCTPTAALAAGGASSIDALDGMIDQAVSDWEPAMAPMVDPIQQALDESIANGDTAEQFLAKLPDLLAQLDPGKLHDLLSRLAFNSRLGAEAGIDQDGNTG